MIINPELTSIQITSVMALDLETTGLEAWREKIDLIALTNEHQTTYVLEVAKYPKEKLRELIVELQKTTIVAHNSKFECNFIYTQFGILLSNLHCTMVTAQIIENGHQQSRGFDYASVVNRYLHKVHLFAAEKKKMQKTFASETIRKSIPQLPSLRQLQFEYAASDTYDLIPLYKLQLNRIKELDLMAVYKLEHTLIPVLTKMECRGTKIDSARWRGLVNTVWVPYLRKVELQIDEEIKRIYPGFKIDRTTVGTVQYSLFGDPVEKTITYGDYFNYSSSLQLIDLFKQLNEPVPTDEEGKPSTSESALSVYITEHPESKLGELIRLLLVYRQFSKLISTYGEGFLDKLDEAGRIHTSYTQTSTETGRLSSRSPNLQNIPKPERGDESTDIRCCFVADPGFKMITCDMDAAEVRIAADCSQEPLLIDSLVNGVDMHSKLASSTFSIIFGTPILVKKSEETIEVGGKKYVLQDLRDSHKMGTFAKFYKAGTKRMYGVFSEWINTHHPPSKRQAIAQQISTSLDKMMPTLTKYLSSLILKAKVKGFLISDPKIKRIRYFDTRNVYGQAANYPIQSINANAQKIALINIDKYLETIGGYLTLNVHDETVSCVPEDIAPQAAKEIDKITSESLGWFLTYIEGKSSTKISSHWKK